MIDCDKNLQLATFTFAKAMRENDVESRSSKMWLPALVAN